MGLFDVGTQLHVTREVPVSLRAAFEVCAGLLRGYEDDGFRVVFEREVPEAALDARVEHPDGTRLTAEVTLTRVESSHPTTRLTLRLRGKVFVGGPKAMFATPKRVRQAAQAQLETYVDETLATLTPEPAEAAPPVVEVSTSAEPAPEEPAPEVPTPDTSSPEVSVLEAPVPEAAASPSPAPETSSPDEPVASPTHERTLEERLELVFELLRRGLISEDDFRRKKRALLQP